MGNADIERLLVRVVEANTKAMEASAAASVKLATEVAGLRSTIQGAQRKIHDEISPIIERGKAAAETLHKEAEAAVRARDNGGTP